jgi:hypothetical protein
MAKPALASRRQNVKWRVRFLSIAAVLASSFESTPRVSIIGDARLT